GGSLALYAWRSETVSTTGSFKWFSRETALLLNNAILVTAAVAVFVGTLYPLVLDAFGLGKISVGRPYFDSMFALIGAPLLLLLGIGPYVRWKSDDPARVRKSLQVVFAISLALGLILPFVIDGALNIGAGLGLAAALWVGITTLQHYIKRVRSASKVPLAYTGMTLAHLGMAMFVAGVTMVMAYEQEKDLRMEPGSSYKMSGYEFKFLGTRKVQGPNYVADEGRIEVYHDGELIEELNPQKRVYNDQNNPMTEASIEISLMRDLYSALGEPLGGGAWSMRLYYKPMIRWIWLGCIFMTIGGVLAVSDRRYRRSRVAKRRVEIPVQVVTQS
ncbi:MAG: c-type cytochrome biogenesis protein CcmF, partial [Gammaproteobacteria bacterium]|nr:c-type cytochrome biogenesis protein CcmF [Gammaproteobacteria bacterium]